MTSNVFLNLRHSVRARRLPEDHIQDMAVAYAADHSDQELRDRLFHASSYLPVAMVFDRVRRNPYKEIAVDQAQSGLLALMVAIERYEPRRHPAFIPFAVRTITPAINEVFVSHLSAVTRYSAADERESDISIHPYVPASGGYAPHTGFDVVDPNGSVLDVLLREENARIQDGHIRATLRSMRRQGSAVRSEIRAATGMSEDSFGRVLAGLYEEYDTPKEAVAEGRVPLTPELTQRFNTLRLRKGLKGDKVVALMVEAFAEAGIAASAASTYTLLHSDTTKKASAGRQTHIDGDRIAAVQGMYDALPDTRLLPGDDEFSRLQGLVGQKKITPADLYGISTRNSLGYDRDAVSRIYGYLENGTNYVPLDLATATFNELDPPGGHRVPNSRSPASPRPGMI